MRRMKVITATTSTPLFWNCWWSIIDIAWTFRGHWTKFASFLIQKQVTKDMNNPFVVSTPVGWIQLQKAVFPKAQCATTSCRSFLF